MPRRSSRSKHASERVRSSGQFYHYSISRDFEGEENLEGDELWEQLASERMAVQEGGQLDIDADILGISVPFDAPDSLW